MQRWTCALCGASFETRTVLLPVYCKCGKVDRSGRLIETIEGPEPEPKLRRVVSVDAHAQNQQSSAAQKVVRMSKAVARWTAAGCPNRSDEEVDKIFTDHCSQCEWFKDDTCTHRKCGCQIRSAKGERSTLVGLFVSKSLSNKVRMATEHCPIGKW